MSTAANIEPVLVFTLAITESGAFGQVNFNIDFAHLWNVLLNIGIKRYIFGSFKIKGSILKNHLIFSYEIK